MVVSAPTPKNGVILNRKILMGNYMLSQTTVRIKFYEKILIMVSRELLTNRIPTLCYPITIFDNDKDQIHSVIHFAKGRTKPCKAFEDHFCSIKSMQTMEYHTIFM